MKVYCPYCHKDVNYTVDKRTVTEFKGLKIKTYENVGVCERCHNDLYIFELEDANIERIYKVYRKTANIIEPQELVDLRQKYDISQRELTSILGFGKMTINRYENGDLPTKSQSDYLKMLINNQEEFLDKVKKAYDSNAIKQKTYEKIMAKSQKTISYEDEIQSIYKKYLNAVLITSQNEYTGYKKFDLEKVETIISYIASKVKNMTLTSLNKYLWFLDMISFSERVLTITGIRYQKQLYGPVIVENMYNELSLLNDKYYREDYEDENGTVSIIKSKNNYDLSKLSKEEKEIVDRVIKLLKNKTVKEISDMSHEEEGWKKTKMYELISFEYAEKLKIER